MSSVDSTTHLFCSQLAGRVSTDVPVTRQVRGLHAVLPLGGAASGRRLVGEHDQWSRGPEQCWSPEAPSVGWLLIRLTRVSAVTETGSAKSALVPSRG
jgi:hypothetical protein